MPSIVKKSNQNKMEKFCESQSDEAKKTGKSHAHTHYFCAIFRIYKKEKKIAIFFFKAKAKKHKEETFKYD